MLLKDEFDTHLATTVREGVRLFNALRPNLVVLDLCLPDEHGLEALRCIRKKDRAARVVILTGFATLEVVEESMRLGASDCLHKPFKAEVLKSRLRELALETEFTEEMPAVSDAPGAYLASDVSPRDLATSSFLHDISNPLTSLHTYSAILKDEVSDSPRAGKLTELIQGSLDYLASLVEQWRAYSEPEMLTDDFGTLSEILEQASKLVQLRAEAKKVPIYLEVSEPEAWPRLNRHAVARILVNLLENAIEAVRSGEGRIDLRGRAKGGYCEFVVEDNGKGISADAAQRVFEPHYTTKKKGTGLGLYIARSILESANGAISICSRPGRGTTFTVQLPIY